MSAFDYTDHSQRTPLLRAVFNCDKEEVRKALKNGYSPNLQDNRGWTPIHEAAIANERSDCLKELLNFSPAKINNQTFLGETALYLACEHNSVKAVELLLTRSNCNLNLGNSEGISPLHIASSKRNTNVIKLLIEHGAKVNNKDFNGYTPLHEIVASGKNVPEWQDEASFEICQYLLSHLANPNLVDDEGNLPFHLACQNGYTKCASLLYSTTKQDIINVSNNDGRTALMMSVQSKNLSLVETLLSLGANPNIADKSSIIALHLAAHSAHFEVFRLILQVSSSECISKYCTFDEERDFKKLLNCKKINSLICLAIDTEDLDFLNQVLESNVGAAILSCPVVHAENLLKKSFTLHTPISFLLESKMSDLGERTIDFLQTLIDHQSPLNVVSKKHPISYINPVCACLISLNDSPKDVVMKCLVILLHHGADPDEPHIRMSFAMEQACMRGCEDAVLLLLQYSNTLEPQDVLEWIELETSSNQEHLVQLLVPLAPAYRLTTSSSKNKQFLEPRVHTLSSHCRHAIRKQLHKVTNSAPHLFREKLLELALPRDIHSYLSFK